MATPQPDLLAALQRLMQPGAQREPTAAALSPRQASGLGSLKYPAALAGPFQWFQDGASIPQSSYLSMLNYGHPGSGTVLEQSSGISPQELAARQAKEKELEAFRNRFIQQAMQAQQSNSSLLNRLGWYSKLMPRQQFRNAPTGTGMLPAGLRESVLPAITQLAATNPSYAPY